MILVTGTGRSGTSVVARLLAVRFGFNMGLHDRRTRPANPEGDYEDVEFRGCNVLRQRGQLQGGAWRWRLRELARDRQEPWGIKDPRASLFIVDYLGLFAPLVIWCDRDLEACARSCVKWYHTTHDAALEEMRRRHTALAHGLASYPHLRLDLNHRRTENELVVELRTWLASQQRRGSFPAPAQLRVRLFDRSLADAGAEIGGR